jgi:hypothetical protein
VVGESWDLSGAPFRDAGGCPVNCYQTSESAAAFTRARGPGRPATWGVAKEIRELWAWGRGGVQLRLPVVNEDPVQLVFPLDHLPAYFPDPRQSCFQVRHD